MLLFGLACPAALSLGWVSAHVPIGDAPVVAQRIESVPKVEHPGLQIGLAAAQFDRMGLSAPKLETPQQNELDVAVAPSAPIEQLFSEVLTAIQATGPRGAVWIVDPDGEDGRRLLKRGEEFRDGWTLSAISDQEVILTREEEMRSVNPFGARPEDPSQPNTAPERPKRSRRAGRAETPG